MICRNLTDIELYPVWSTITIKLIQGLLPFIINHLLALALYIRKKRVTSDRRPSPRVYAIWQIQR
eukprot:scaffold2480_cov104-Skeletonema_marinoi.AAC.1